MTSLSLTEKRATQIATKLQKIADRYNSKETFKGFHISIGGRGDHGCDVQVYAFLDDNGNGQVAVSLDDYGIVKSLIAEAVTIYDEEHAECEGVGDALIKMLNKPAQKNADAQPWSSSCYHITWNN